jgi:hypothetical protein
VVVGIVIPNPDKPTCSSVLTLGGSTGDGKEPLLRGQLG